MYKIVIAFILFLNLTPIFGQKVEMKIEGLRNSVAKLQFLQGENSIFIDSISSKENGRFQFQLDNKKQHIGFYRLWFDDKRWIDFVNDNEDLEISTNAANILDSLKILASGSNKLYYQFIKLNKAFKTKTELLQLILARYPKDDVYYHQTKMRLQEIENEYILFVNETAQKEPTSFIAKYIRSAQLPVIDSEIPLEKQLDYLKTHALDNVDFDNTSLIYSDAFTNKSIEYLTYYRNPQLPRELLEKEFMKAVDTLLNKAKVNQLIYQHITEYLIDGFKKFGFDKILDYIVENYVIKDDLCLDVKTEGLIKRRIDQAKYFKIGNVVPDISVPDINGKEVRLSKLNAEKVLIVFYASWCPHCKELLPKLNEFSKQQKEKKLEVLAISLDSKKEDWSNFVKENCSSLLNASDLKGWDGKAENDYFIYATPTMFLVNKELKIIAKPMNIEEVKKDL